MSGILSKILGVDIEITIKNPRAQCILAIGLSIGLAVFFACLGVYYVKKGLAEAERKASAAMEKAVSTEKEVTSLRNETEEIKNGNHLIPTIIVNTPALKEEKVERATTETREILETLE